MQLIIHDPLSKQLHMPCLSYVSWLEFAWLRCRTMRLVNSSFTLIEPDAAFHFHFWLLNFTLSKKIISSTIGRAASWLALITFSSMAELDYLSKGRILLTRQRSTSPSLGRPTAKVDMDVYLAFTERQRTSARNLDCWFPSWFFIFTQQFRLAWPSGRCLTKAKCGIWKEDREHTPTGLVSAANSRDLTSLAKLQQLLPPVLPCGLIVPLTR
jgi:hypothetical protein